MTKMLTIGDLAAATGTKVNTIRYYEETGLMPKPLRSGSGRRLYGQGDLRRLAFIRHARALGFRPEAVRSLLALNDQPERACGEVRDLAQGHLEEVTERLARLLSLQRELNRMISACDDGRRVADCRIMEALAQNNSVANAAPGLEAGR